MPTPPLPDEIEQRPGLRAGLGERDGPPLGVPVRLTLTGRRAGITVQPLAQLLAVVVGHHGELEVDAGDTVEWGDGVGDAVV